MCKKDRKSNIREVLQKLADKFNRMFAIAAMLLIFCVKGVLYMSVKYSCTSKINKMSQSLLEPVTKTIQEDQWS